MLDKKNEPVVKKDDITFTNALTGSISVNREILVRNLQTEHRSYANFPCSRKDSEGDNIAIFSIPETEDMYPQGWKIGVTIHIADNAKGNKKKKGSMSV